MLQNLRMDTSSFVLIEKEEVESLHFPSEDVLTTENDKAQRKIAVDRGTEGIGTLQSKDLFC